MSVNKLQNLAQQFADAFDQRDVQPILDMLSEDVEVFDHAPYRFDGKALFTKYLIEVIASLSSSSFGFRQPWCRVYSDEVGIVNARDMLTGVTKDGKTLSIHGRTTLVFIKQSGQWKIVSAHFSAIPKALLESSQGIGRLEVHHEYQ
jgi:ketosteroid isomerase-like protein